MPNRVSDWFSKLLQPSNESLATIPKKHELTQRTQRFISKVKLTRRVNAPRDKVVHRARRASNLFGVGIARADAPSSWADQTLALADPWWSKELVLKPNESSPEPQIDEQKLVSQDEVTLTLLDGREIKQVRSVFLTKDGSRLKTFKARIGQEEFNFDQIPKELLPLYGLDDEITTNADFVVVCEGFAAAKALMANRIPAVATLTGALETPPTMSLMPLLRKQAIYLWPDNDRVGVRHMHRIAARLKKVGAREIKIIRWKNGPRKGDAEDYLNQNLNFEDLKNEAKSWSVEHAPGSRGSVRLNPGRTPVKLRLSNSELPISN